MHNKFLFWASIFLRFANQWFSCSFCWSQQPFVKVHCMGCSIGLECGRVSFFRQSHVWQANSEIMQMRGKKEERLGWRENQKMTFYFARASPSFLAALPLDPPCAHDLPFTTLSFTCSWSTVIQKKNKEWLAVFIGETLYGETCIKYTPITMWDISLCLLS